MNPSIHPSERDWFGIVYNSTHDKVVLYGGTPDGVNNLGDTWVYDLVSDSWSNMNPSGPTPGLRRNSELTYNSGQDKVVLYGGFNDGTAYSDTWVYDLASNAYSGNFYQSFRF